MQNMRIVKISQSLQELLHVALDLRLVKVDVRVRQHSAQIVVGVWRDHVQSGTLLALGAFLVGCLPLNSHLFQLQDIRMAEHLEQLHLAERSDRKSILLVVHQDLFKSEDLS